MDEISALFTLDYENLITSIFIFLIGALAILEVVEKVSQKIGKPVSWIKSQNKDHELLQNTIAQLNALTEHHDKDKNELSEQEESLQEELKKFAKEIQDAIQQINVANEKTQDEIKQFAENRIHDREQSFVIQEELNTSISKLADGALEREKSISALSEGVRELLGDALDQKFSHYVALSGIPENEVDEYISMNNAYFANGGNHKRKDKYEYVINHMKVIPVETNLLNVIETD